MRIIHPFISEEDLPSLIQKASEGSLGGAGDTASIHGLIGAYPLFIDVTAFTSERWEYTVTYLKSKGFLKLAEWFDTCASNKYDRLIKMTTTELINEWNNFRSRAFRELDIGPWATRYIRRCVLASENNEEKIAKIEEAFLRGTMSQKDYNAPILKLQKPRNSKL